MSVVLSEAAARHIGASIAGATSSPGVRLLVRNRGCAGYFYQLDRASEIAPEDVAFEQHGVRLLVRQRDLPHLDGTHIDYVPGAAGQGLRYDNPNERERCGCEESFRP